MTKQVAVGCLRVRNNPSLEEGVSSFIFMNDYFDILETSEDGLWLKVRMTGDMEGWISKSRWYEAVPEEELAKTMDPPWLKVALDEFKAGVKEVPGPGVNQRIVEYLKTTTLEPAAAENDQTHWCSGFVNWCFKQCEIEGTGSPAAKSWLGFGAKLTKPRKGCVVVFDRPPDPLSGHVAFYIGEVGNESIAVLGGNQGDAISIDTYPRKRLRGFRWPQEEDIPDN